MTPAQIALLAIALLPLVAALRRWPPDIHFLLPALGYAAMGGLKLTQTRIALSQAPAPGNAYSDTYYTVSNGHFLLSSAIIFAVLAGVIWIQRRFGALIFPKLTLACFWLLHGAWLVQAGITLSASAVFRPPRRYIDYAEFMQQIAGISSASAKGIGLALLGLLALLIVSIAARITSARHREAE